MYQNHADTSIFKSAIIVSLIIIASKLLGFGREVIIANFYGANSMTDAFFFANAMPAMLFPSICNSLSTAFVTLYIGKMKTDGIKSDLYASRMLLWTTLASICLSIIGIIITPKIVPVFAPGFVGKQLELAVSLSRLSMSAFVFIMLQYMLSSILNSKKIFVGSQICGLLYNAVIISATLFIGQGHTMKTLMIIMIFGSLSHVLGLFYLCKMNMHVCFFVRPCKQEIKELFILSLPILLSNTVVQLSTIVEKYLGSSLTNGSISALSYAGVLRNLVISVVVMSLSTVLYPTLASSIADNNVEQYKNNLTFSLTGLNLLIIPIAFITLIDSKLIVSIVFNRGNFSQDAVKLTSIVLMSYAPSFIFIGFREVLTRAFFAIKDTKTPMINGTIGILCSIVFCVTFTQTLGLYGLALGTTVSSFVTMVLLFWNAFKLLPAISFTDIIYSVSKQFIAGLGMICIILIIHNCNIDMKDMYMFVVDTFAGVLAYLVFLILLKSREIIVLKKILIEKFKTRCL